MPFSLTQFFHWIFAKKKTVTHIHNVGKATNQPNQIFPIRWFWWCLHRYCWPSIGHNQSMYALIKCSWIETQLILIVFNEMEFVRMMRVFFSIDRFDCKRCHCLPPVRHLSTLALMIVHGKRCNGKAFVAFTRVTMHAF